jgi:hypothetical protein
MGVQPVYARPRQRGRDAGRSRLGYAASVTHALPLVIDDTHTALKVAYTVVGVELVGIGWVRRRFLRVPLHLSLVQVTLGGCVVDRRWRPDRRRIAAHDQVLR